jgi:hypothetical protein
MEGYTFCQSCGMPMDQPKSMGIEKDSSKSTIYCNYCYRDGEFADPDMTIEEMQEHLRAELRKTHTTEAVIARAVARLPYLGRWMGIPAIHHCREWH